MDLETRLGVIIDSYISGLDSNYKKDFVDRLMSEYQHEIKKIEAKYEGKFVMMQALGAVRYANVGLKPPLIMYVDTDSIKIESEASKNVDIISDKK